MNEMFCCVLPYKIKLLKTGVFASLSAGYAMFAVFDDIWINPRNLNKKKPAKFLSQELMAVLVLF